MGSGIIFSGETEKFKATEDRAIGQSFIKVLAGLPRRSLSPAQCITLDLWARGIGCHPFVLCYFLRVPSRHSQSVPLEVVPA